jgi:hypothetical protein
MTNSAATLPSSSDSTFLGLPTTPPTTARRRASVAAGSLSVSASNEIIPKFELPNPATPASTSVPIPIPSSSPTSTTPQPHSSPKSTKNEHKHSKLSVPSTSRTSFDELVPPPDTRRRAASVAGVTPPVLPTIIAQPVQHSTSAPDIQKLGILFILIFSSHLLLPFCLPSSLPLPLTKIKLNYSLELQQQQGLSVTVSTGSGGVSGGETTLPTTSVKGSFLKMGTGTASPPVISSNHYPIPSISINSKTNDAASRMRSRCVVQLLLIHAVDDILFVFFSFLLSFFYSLVV